MKIVKVTYTAKAEFALENQSNIKNVMTDLQKINNPGILYHCCVGEDGISFIHTAFFNADENEKILLELPAFKHFQMELKTKGLTAPPKQEHLSLVGSSKNLFN
ncbi:MAG TPA: hypothetical protein VFJ43_11400 [Bacteroidia bacterium]|nr:hypothetical protein [Bacteroidia bacterium]